MGGLPIGCDLWCARRWIVRRTSASSILESYSACNTTAHVVAQPPVWTPALSDAFEASITVHIPQLLLTRTPGVVETLKLAFIHYIAMFIPIATLLRCLRGACFKTGVLTARVHHPIKQH